MPLPDPDRYETQTWEYTMLVSMLETYSKPSLFIWKKANEVKDPALKKKYYEKSFSMMLENRDYVFNRLEQGLISPNIVSWESLEL